MLVHRKLNYFTPIITYRVSDHSSVQKSKILSPNEAIINSSILYVSGGPCCIDIIR
jgi:hypothetical protein